MSRVQVKNWNPGVDYILCTAPKISDETESGVILPPAEIERRKKERASQMLTVVSNGPLVKNPLKPGSMVIAKNALALDTIEGPSMDTDYAQFKEYDLVGYMEPEVNQLGHGVGVQ